MNLANAPPGGRGLRILHADDHLANRRLVQEILRSSGHHPMACCGGAEALDLLRRHAFDIVLMDINMPGLGGVETVRRLRAARGPARNVPVIALTSELRRSLADYQALGFNGFVSKPFLISDFLAAIERCAAAAPRPRPGASSGRSDLTRALPDSQPRIARHVAPGPVFGVEPRAGEQLAEAWLDPGPPVPAYERHRGVAPPGPARRTAPTPSAGERR